MKPIQRHRATARHQLGTFAIAAMVALVASSAMLVADPASMGRARAAVPTPTTTTLDPLPAVVYGPLDLTGHVSPAPQTVDGFIPALSFTLDGAFWLPAPIQGDGSAVTSGLPPLGIHVITARWDGNAEFAASESATQTIDVRVGTATTLTSSLNPALSTQAVTLTAFLTTTTPGTLGGGTLSIIDTTSSTTLGSMPVGPAPATLVVTTTLSVGTHILRAEYSGHGSVEASSSPDLSQSILADLAVDAGGFRVTPSTFYPVKDGYRDRLGISGRTNEPASVTIKIYRVSTGKRVRTASLGTTTGAYAWAWNGRKSDGSMVAAGKYRIVQTVIDTGGNRLASTLYANVSLKKIVWKTVTRTQDGDDYVIQGTGGTGSVRQRSSSYARGVRISSGSQWAGVGYAFSAPTGAVYKNVTFKVLGRSSNGGRAVIAIWAPAAGGYRNLDNYDYAALIGPGYRWWTTTAPLKSHRGDGKIRTTVAVANDGSVNTFDIAQVRVTYTYGVLK